MVRQRRAQWLNRTNGNGGDLQSFQLEPTPQIRLPLWKSGHHFKPALREYGASQSPLGSARSHPVSRSDAVMLALAGSASLPDCLQ